MIITMTHPSHSHWRLAFARELGLKLRNLSGLSAIVVGGSVARGFADEYSDLEMPLFWETLPTDDLRLAIAADLGADFLYPFNGPAWEDNLLIQGLQVDLWHCAVSDEEQVIASVLQGSNLDLGASNFMDTLRSCVPLHGEELIACWKAKAQIYPDDLAARNIAQAVSALEATHLSVLARRGNSTLFYGQVSAIQQQVFMILLALNRRYFPTFKWIYPTLAELAIKPDAAEARFRQAYTLPPLEAAEDTARIVTETLRLVEAQFPQIDTKEVPNQLRITRAAHTEPVRYKA